jgi:hypothetical protein
MNLTRFNKRIKAFFYVEEATIEAPGKRRSWYQRQQFIFPAILILFTSATYGRLLDMGIHSYADWGFKDSSSLKGLLDFSIWIANLGFGSADITFWHAPVSCFNGVFGLLGFASNVSDWFVFFLPLVLLSALAPYYFLVSITKNRFAAAIGTLVFSLNTYYLTISTQGHILLTIAGCISLLAAWAYFRALELAKKRLFLIAGILLSITGFVDFRVAYITLIIFALMVVYHLIVARKRFSFLGHLILALVFVGLNVFWLLPLSVSGDATNNAILGRSLFGNSFWNLSASLSLVHPFWNGGKPNWFVVQPIAFYEWLLPALAFGGVFLLSSHKQKKYLFWAVLGVVGVFFSKQVDYPLPDVYPWLFTHIPGFGALRESSKFYFLTALSYSVLISGLIAWTYELRRVSVKWLYVSIGTASLVIILTLINILPIITGKIQTLYSDRSIPNEYTVFNNFIARQNEQFRVMWVPGSSRWAMNSNEHPQLNADEVNSTWTNFIGQELKLGEFQDRQRMLEIFKHNYSAPLLAASNVKYVVVPTRDFSNDADIFKYYGDDRNYFTNALDSVTWLRRINLGGGELAVYENLKYDSNGYISSKTNILAMSPNNLDEKIALINKVTPELSGDISYTDNDFNNSYLSIIKDPFEDLARSSLIKGLIVSPANSHGSANSSIVASQNDASLSYQTIKGALTIFQDRTTLNINQLIVLPAQQQVISEIKTKPKRSYYFENGVTNERLVDGGVLGKQDGAGKVYSISQSPTENLLTNPSFEAGTWGEKVQDCNNYDGNSSISMSINDTDSTDQGKSLELAGTRHTACISSNNFSVNPGTSLFLSFNYKVFVGRDVAYKVTFDDQARTGKEIHIDGGGPKWRNFTGFINVPKGATHAVLTLESPGNQQDTVSNIVRFDDTQVYVASLEAEIPGGNKEPATAVPEAVQGKITYSTQNSFTNLVKNGSLEDGTWQQKVGDCNAESGAADIDMKTDKTFASDGKQSLELIAKTHVACTGPDNVTVSGNEPYFLSFDYQSPNAINAGVNIEFNDPSRSNITRTIPITNNLKHTYSDVLKAPPGADSAKLTFYSFSSGGKIAVITRYDNVFMTKIDAVQSLYYSIQKAPDLNKPKSLTYDIKSATKKSVAVKGATTPFFVVMSEAYHPKWQLEISNTKNNGINAWVPWAKPDSITEADHFKLNNFENGWYVDVDKLCKQQNLCIKNAVGSYDMEMVAEFTPQRWFYVGLIISGTTLLVVLGGFGYTGVRRHLHRKDIKRNGGRSVQPPAPKEVVERVLKKGRRIVRL